MLLGLKVKLWNGLIWNKGGCKKVRLVLGGTYKVKNLIAMQTMGKIGLKHMTDNPTFLGINWVTLDDKTIFHT